MDDSVTGEDLRAPSAPAKASIGKGRLLLGATAFKDAGIPNLGDTYRAQILTANGVRAAIVKDIPLRELANEIMAATLASALGLPTPPAFIVAATESVLVTRYAPKVDKVSFLFGSADLSSPSVAQIINTKMGLDLAALRRVIDALVKSGRLGSLYGFDAWAANIDRHPGNILLAFDALPWLIDHGRCFTGQNWVPNDLVADRSFVSRLKGWLTPKLSASQKRNTPKRSTHL
ncbi:HipA family kinase [Bradyrhizobium sp. USDA 329]|uniref:HipA family kinase n=1 Tax=unclassified Bradyrhizobium TaxID=2631580 RepID=UPI003511E19B